jgi:hypothetical protein
MTSAPNTAEPTAAGCDLSLRRADYNGIVKNEGYPALLAHIEAKIRETRSDE